MIIKKRKVDVVFLFEKAQRELTAITLIAHFLEKNHKLRVKIFQQNTSVLEALCINTPKVVVLPYCYQNRSHKIFFIRWSQSLFLNLTWEQILYPGVSSAKVPKGTLAINHVIHHTWGTNYSSLLKTIGVPENNIFKNGNLAFTLYNKKYASFFLNKAELSKRYKLNNNKKWVFFPENFNWAFYGQDMINQMINDGQPPEQILRLQKYVTKSFEIIANWCSSLCHNKDLILIIRQRPAITGTLFFNRFREIIGDVPDNMVFINRETVRDWILSSDIIVSTVSTSLLEACVANKPLILLLPLEPLNDLLQPWHSLSPTARNFIEFNNLITECNTLNTKNLKEWISENINFSIEDPFVNISNFIADLIKKKNDIEIPLNAIMEPDSKYLWFKSKWFYFINLYSLLNRIIEKKIGNTNFPDDEYKIDKAEEERIQTYLNNWDTILNVE